MLPVCFLHAIIDYNFAVFPACYNPCVSCMLLQAIIHISPPMCFLTFQNLLEVSLDCRMPTFIVALLFRVIIPLLFQTNFLFITKKLFIVISYIFLVHCMLMFIIPLLFHVYFLFIACLRL